MRYSIRTRIEIDAPAAVVWDLLVDLDQYHRWNVEGAEFAWTGAILHPWFAKGEHLFRLRTIAADRVLVEHDEVFFGIGDPLVGLVGSKLTRRGFDAMNQALKHEAEARSQ